MHQSTLKEFVQTSQGEKRNLDESDQDSSTPLKKPCNQDDTQNEMINKDEKPTAPLTLGEELDVRFASMLNHMTTHITTLTTKMETSLYDKMKKSMEDIVAAEIESSMKTLKEEMKKENDALKAHLTAVENRSYAAVTSDNRDSHLIVIKNLPESANESEDKNVLKNKVDSLMKDGMKIQTPKIKSVERKKSRNTKHPGIVVITCENKIERDNIMKHKRNLKGKVQYKRVWLEEWLPRSTMSIQQSLRTVFKELGKEKEYFINGTSVVKKKGSR